MGFSNGWCSLGEGVGATANENEVFEARGGKGDGGSATDATGSTSDQNDFTCGREERQGWSDAGIGCGESELCV